MASIPDTLSCLEGYCDDYDYDLEELYEDAAAVRVHCLAGHPALAQLCQKGLKGTTSSDNCSIVHILFHMHLMPLTKA